MFGRARLAPRPYFGLAKVPTRPPRDVTTSRSVVQLSCGSIRIAKVRPCSSMLAGAEAEMTVSRLNVSRVYWRRRRPSSMCVA